MSKKTLGSVACEVPGGFSEFVSFESRVSLLEWDIILFNPSITDYLDTSKTYQGKPSLNDYHSVTSSRKLRDIAADENSPRLWGRARPSLSFCRHFRKPRSAHRAS